MSIISPLYCGRDAKFCVSTFFHNVIFAHPVLLWVCVMFFSLTMQAQDTARYSFCPSAPIARDHEGNVYRTVQIGSQCWMAENMRCTTSPSGYRWYGNPRFSAADPEYAPYYATPLDPRHGMFYNWAAAMDLPASQNNSKAFLGPVRGICPRTRRC